MNDSKSTDILVMQGEQDALMENAPQGTKGYRMLDGLQKSLNIKGCTSSPSLLKQPPHAIHQAQDRVLSVCSLICSLSICASQYQSVMARKKRYLCTSNHVISVDSSNVYPNVGLLCNSCNTLSNVTLRMAFTQEEQWIFVLCFCLFVHFVK